MVKLVFVVLMVCGLTSFSQACFPSKYWISCLIDTCKLGGSCPGDPTAHCRMDRSECDGCEAVWYNQNGQRANCSAIKDLQLCPGGETVVHCKMDPCQWPCDHPKFRHAPCQKNYCGKCVAEYYVDGMWSQCPAQDSTSAGAVLPIDTVLNPEKVVGSCMMVPCSIEVCLGQRCSGVKGAVCRPYACNECQPMWYLGDMPVDCVTKEFIQGLPRQQQPIVNPPGMVFPVSQRTCKPGEPYVPCDQSACNGQICRNYPNAICRPDGCGQCKATWYLDDQLVDCLSDQCPPNVPFVRCVDDPCKYFSHYCPTTECRASQCGKCEAKFFVNGNEIDCVMPPKPCPAGVEPLVCPYFTCPANICPSNSRLMCRINPCGTECSHEWVDIYNGERRTCRTFDREKSPVTRSGGFKQPEMNKIFFKDPILHALEPSSSNLPFFVDKKSHSKIHTKEITTSTVPRKSASVVDLRTPGGLSQNEVGGFRVEPMFINPGPPIKDIDILALLRSFPHEVSVIPSSAIKSGLKKPYPVISGGSGPALVTRNSVPESLVQSKPARNFVNAGQQTKPIQNGMQMVPKTVKQDVPMATMQQKMPMLPVQQDIPIMPVQNDIPVVPLQQNVMPFQGQQDVLPLQNMPMMPPKPLSNQMPPEQNLPKVIELKHNEPATSFPMEPMNNPGSLTADKAMALLAELNNKAAASDIGQPFPAAGVPQSVEQPAVNPPLYPETELLAPNSPSLSNVKTKSAMVAKPRGGRKSKAKKSSRKPSTMNNGGLPISMNLFSQWSTLPFP